MNAIAPFDFEGAPVRVLTRDGAPYFVLADVCRVLEIVNSGTAAGRLDDDEKGIHTMDTPPVYSPCASSASPACIP